MAAKPDYNRQDSFCVLSWHAQHRSFQPSTQHYKSFFMVLQFVWLVALVAITVSLRHPDNLTELAFRADVNRLLGNFDLAGNHLSKESSLRNNPKIALPLMLRGHHRLPYSHVAMTMYSMPFSDQVKHRTVYNKVPRSYISNPVLISTNALSYVKPEIVRYNPQIHRANVPLSYRMSPPLDLTSL